MSLAFVHAWVCPYCLTFSIPVGLLRVIAADYAVATDKNQCGSLLLLRAVAPSYGMHAIHAMYQCLGLFTLNYGLL